MVKLMNSNISGERFILVSENVAMKDFLGMIADELKVKRPRFELSNVMGEIGWRFEKLRSLVANTEARFTKTDMRIARIPFHYNNSKIIQATGYSFRPVAQSIQETTKVFLDSKMKGMPYGTFE
jgi:hypothetical protein